MRTTLSIDDDVASLVDHEMKRSGDSLKGTINRLLKLGAIAAQKPEPIKPFVITPFPMGLGLVRKTDKVSEMLEELEGPYHR